MPDIESVKFDTAGWTLEEISFELKRWTNPKAQFLSFHHFNVAPDIPAALTDINSLRQAYRLDLSESGAAMISADVFTVNHLDCIMLVFKAPSQPHGMIYVGSLTFPFEEFSYVVKIQCAELNNSGARDTVVLDLAMREGAVAFDPEDGSVVGWTADPYDPSFVAPLLSNLSDKQQFDTMFPDHPLTDVRVCLNHILQTIHADEEILISPRFVPSVKPRTRVDIEAEARRELKPWWRFW